MWELPKNINTRNARTANNYYENTNVNEHRKLSTMLNNAHIDFSRELKEEEDLISPLTKIIGDVQISA